MEPTLLHRLALWAKELPQQSAQAYKRKGKWKTIRVKEYCSRVYYLSLYLESQGLQSSDILTILSYNCPAWVHTQLAAILAGAKAAGIYPNASQKDIHYILNHTESRFFCIQNHFYFQKLGDVTLPNRIQRIIVFEGDCSFSPKAISYQAALKEGRKLALSQGAKSLQNFLDALKPHEGAFVIYTSGTTGNPKGAVLSHDNLIYTVDLGIRHWDLRSLAEGSLFSFLPLCHIAETLQNLAAGITLRWKVSFCSQFDKIAEEINEIQPTLLLCVPRIWEKMMEGVLSRIESMPPVRQKLVRWGLQVGARLNPMRLFGQPLSWFQKCELKLAEKLVLSKISHVLGLTKAKVLVSGAAVLPVSVCRWFQGLGYEIVEDFGQTESSGIICMTLRGQDCSGTVGKPVPGIDFQLADDGEIYTRGRHVFKEYLKDPQSTQSVLKEGWLLTGDLGEWDPSGLLRIKGRKKDILKTSGGKMVAPLPIEEALKNAPGISQVCVVGDGRKFLTALITLTESYQKIWSKDSKIARQLIDPKLQQEFQKVLNRVNKNLAGYEQVKKFAILAREFSVEAGEMTPTLKIKRNVIEKNYQDIIESLYRVS